jgi:hypothetical protein
MVGRGDVKKAYSSMFLQSVPTPSFVCPTYIEPSSDAPGVIAKMVHAAAFETSRSAAKRQRQL